MKPKSVSSEYPKWVTVHESLIHRQKARDGQVRPGSENSLRVSDEAPDHISVPGFAHVHVDRAGNVTVMVADAEEEKKATEAAQKMTPEGQKLHDFLNDVIAKQRPVMPEIGGSKLAEDFVSMMTEIRTAIDESKATVKAAVQELKQEIVQGSQSSSQESAC